MIAPVDSAPSPRGSPEPLRQSTKSKRRFLDRITGGHRYRLVYWIIALAALVLVADWFLADQGIYAYYTAGWFNPTTGKMRLDYKIYRLTVHSTYSDSFWTPIASQFVPQEMIQNKWYYVSGNGYSLLSKEYSDGEGGDLMTAAQSLLFVLGQKNYSKEAKRAAIDFFVEYSLYDDYREYLQDYAQRIQDFSSNWKEPLDENGIRMAGEVWKFYTEMTEKYRHEPPQNIPGNI